MPRPTRPKRHAVRTRSVWATAARRKELLLFSWCHDSAVARRAPAHQSAADGWLSTSAARQTTNPCDPSTVDRSRLLDDGGRSLVSFGLKTMQHRCAIVASRSLTGSVVARPCGVLPYARGTLLRLSGKSLEPSEFIQRSLHVRRSSPLRGEDIHGGLPRDVRADPCLTVPLIETQRSYRDRQAAESPRRCSSRRRLGAELDRSVGISVAFGVSSGLALASLLDPSGSPGRG
jgi:hypothetical protein